MSAKFSASPALATVAPPDTVATVEPASQEPDRGARAGTDPAGTGSAPVQIAGRPPYAWLLAGIWLFYLWQPVVTAWRSPVPAFRWLGLAVLASFAGLYLYAFARGRPNRSGERHSPRSGIAITAGAALMVAALTAMIGPEALPLVVYVAVLGIFLLPAFGGLLTAAGLIFTVFVANRLLPHGNTSAQIELQILIASLAIWGVRQVILRNAQLTAARNEITRLAIAEERNRFARDLHDILGHSLTVVAVKAELAGRLVRQDPARAEAEINDVERLSREALADVRAALSGYREVNLTGELLHARAALAAAGIDAELPGAVEEVPADRRELFGWVLREGVTNVVRHSGASRCRIDVTPHEIRIADDGRGPTNSSIVDGRGHGLRGLRERAEAAGGSLAVGHRPGGGFELTVRV